MISKLFYKGVKMQAVKSSDLLSLSLSRLASVFKFFFKNSQVFPSLLKNSLKAKKLILVALIAVFAAQNARAEKDGFFFGGAVFPAISVGTTTNEYKWRYSTNKKIEQELIVSLVQLAFGYTHALGERLGLRYYGVFYYNPLNHF